MSVMNAERKAIYDTHDKQLIDKYHRCLVERNNIIRATHIIVNKAIKEGVITKPKLCAFCPNEAKHAHHKDYTKPLDVLWLCNSCHRLLHLNSPPFKGTFLKG